MSGMMSGPQQYRSCDFIISSQQSQAPGATNQDTVEENMFVTAGDSVTVLNSKDVVLKTFFPSSHMQLVPVQHHHGGGTSSYTSSILEENANSKYSQIRFLKVSSQTIGGAK